jgi:hypothetical protein
MTLRLQESGGGRWTAAVQSPVPVRGTRRLTRAQRAVLLGIVVLFCLGQLLYVFTPKRTQPSASPSGSPGTVR